MLIISPSLGFVFSSQDRRGSAHAAHQTQLHTWRPRPMCCIPSYLSIHMQPLRSLCLSSCECSCVIDAVMSCPDFRRLSTWTPQQKANLGSQSHQLQRFSGFSSSVEILPIVVATFPGWHPSRSTTATSAPAKPIHIVHCTTKPPALPPVYNLSRRRCLNIQQIYLSATLHCVNAAAITSELNIAFF